MNTYKLTVKESRSGKTHHERVRAANVEAACEGFALPGFEVVGGELVDPASPPVIAAFSPQSTDGSYLSVVALVAGIGSLLFVPLVLAALVLGGFALEQSRGKRGAAGVVLSVVSLLGWGLWVLLLILRQPIYR